MNAYEQQLKTFLEIAAKAGSDQQGYAYRNMHDFLNQHGVFYEPRVKPKKILSGVPRCCYGNSIMAAVKYEWSYVEGVAMMSLGVPVHHAWNLLPDGSIMDITWRRPGMAYCGVVFSIGRADDATWNGDSCVLDDFQRDWPLFREPWTGEDFDRAWEASGPLIDAMRFSERSAKV